MAAAWGIAALWFFCFGWWKDYLQSPTIAQRLDTRTHRSQAYFWFSHMPVKQTMQQRDAKTHTCRLIKRPGWPGSAMGDHRYRFKKLWHDSYTGVTPRNTRRPFNQTGPWFTLPLWANCQKKKPPAMSLTRNKPKKLIQLIPISLILDLIWLHSGCDELPNRLKQTPSCLPPQISSKQAHFILPN